MTKESQSDPDEFDSLQKVIEALREHDVDARKRIFDSAATFLSINVALPNEIKGAASYLPSTGERPSYPAFSLDTTMSPKEFIYQKQPKTDIERVAVLAFYLTHYRDTPYFKTLDLNKLNTEAAQPRFSNAAGAVNNSIKAGYLILVTKGNRQISAVGERFVNALPDREEAKGILAASLPRRKPKKTLAKGTTRSRKKLV